jgi:hypothetical protein
LLILRTCRRRFLMVVCVTRTIVIVSADQSFQLLMINEV